MRKWQKYLIGILICMFIIIGVFYPSEVVHQRELPLPQENWNGFEIKLTSWIYNNSSKISKEQAYKLAKEINKYDMPLLLTAVIKHESIRFDPTATSSKGAIGYCQVMFEAHKVMLNKIGVQERRDLYNMEDNIKAGHLILSDCLTQHKGDLPKALETYVRGYTSGKDGAYVKEILTNLGNLYVYMSREEGR